MTYRQGFDRLGNQLPPRRPNWYQRLVIRISCAVVSGCVFAMLWVK